MGEVTTEQDVVQNILTLDPRVRFVGIIDDEGQLVKGGMKEGVRALEPTKKDEDKLYLKWFLIQAMTNEWNSFLGDKILLYTRYEKVEMYGIPLKNSMILLVSTKNIKVPHFFGDRLLEIVKESNL